MAFAAPILTKKEFRLDVRHGSRSPTPRTADGARDESVRDLECSLGGPHARI